MMYLLLFVLTIWVLLALAGLPTNNPEFACLDLAVWTEVDPSAEDQAYFEEQADQQRPVFPPLARFPFQLVSYYLLYPVQSTFVLSSDVILM